MLVGSNHLNTEKNGGKPVNHNLVNFCDLSSDASAWQSSLNYPPPRGGGPLAQIGPHGAIWKVQHLQIVIEL